MKIIALLGTFGSGKTATGLKLAEALGAQGFASYQILYLVNEAGGLTEFATSAAQIQILPNGCFTCQDDADLLQALTTAEADGIEVVILEGFGLVSGHEIKDFLETKTRFSYQLVAVVDSQLFAVNQLDYGALLATHVQVATAGIIMTKVPKNMKLTDPKLAVLRGFIETERQESVPVTATHLPEWPVALIDAVLRYRLRFVSRGHHDCSSHCNHQSHVIINQQHHGDSSAVHGWRMMGLTLKAHVTLTDLKQLFGSFVQAGSVRLKGNVGGVSFNVAPRETDWNEGPSNLSAYCIVYLKDGAVDIADVSNLSELATEPPRLARSFELVRIDTDPAATRLRIQALLAKLDALPVQFTPHGALVTHPEPLQVLKEMARRPAVKSEYFLPVIAACVRYWLRTAQWLTEHSRQVTSDQLVHNRELAVSLAWWATEFNDSLPDPLYVLVAAEKPAVMMARGLVSLATLRHDSFWRHWQVVEYERALGFAGNLSVVERACVIQATQHLKQLKAQMVLIA